MFLNFTSVFPGVKIEVTPNGALVRESHQKKKPNNSGLGIVVSNLPRYDIFCVFPPFQKLHSSTCLRKNRFPLHKPPFYWLRLSLSFLHFLPRCSGPRLTSSGAVQADPRGVVLFHLPWMSFHWSRSLAIYI